MNFPDCNIEAVASFGSTNRSFPDSVHEPEPPSPPPVRERLVRCLWFDQEFDVTLRTEAGEKVTVLSPGWWNLESGPDFKNASLRLAGGKALKGDVEVHLDASGWTQHGHHQDPAYNRVILHVVMRNDTGAEASTREDGADVPILSLAGHVRGTLDDLNASLATEDYPHASEGAAGRCQELIAQAGIDPEWIGQFLDHAGDERMLHKAERFAEMPEADAPESVLYVSLMEAAGFKKNKRPMGRLARLVPLEVAQRLLREGGQVALQAALFGMAGLLPEQLDLTGAEADAETAAYIGQLRSTWADLRDGLEGGAMEARSWNFSGTRPVNYPMRRIAGLARLIETAVLAGGLIPAIEAQLRRAPAAPSRRVARSPAAKAVVVLLTGGEDDYWSWHTTFGGKRLRSKTKLIGTDRAHVMFVDAIVPIMLAVARAGGDRDMENRLHRAYATLPRLPENSVHRFMVSRIFGGAAHADPILTSARRQQGLLQLFRDYCEADAAGCRHCPFAEALQQP